MTERMNRTVLDKLRTVIISSGLPRSLWAELASEIFFVLSHAPSANLDLLTPYSVLFDKFPKNSVEVTCGSLVVAHYRRAEKLVARGRAMYVVGFCIGQVGLRLWDPEKNLVKVYRDFKKYEEILFKNRHKGTIEESKKRFDMDNELKELCKIIFM
jgi:hypothetical protein